MNSQPHARPAEGVLADLGTDPATGLTELEAEGRLSRDGPNVLAAPPKESALLRLGRQFASPLVLALLVAAVVACVEGANRKSETLLGRFGDATAILVIVVLNALLGFFQELRADTALKALQRLQTSNARVRRGGLVSVVPAASLVVGDIIAIAAGDAVPADARLVHGEGLVAEESSLTGESVPVGKNANAVLGDDTPLAERTTMIYIGTSVVRGKGSAVVVATGPRTELGRVSSIIRRPADRTTPLEEKLNAFGKRILWACVAFSTLLFAHGVILGDRSWHVLLLEAISLAVAAIPEGLPAITTITLALGIQRMAATGAIVRRLAAVETLGAATVICTDKTGTLTRNEMTVREICAGVDCYAATGVGYDPRGDVLDAGGRRVLEPAEPLRDLLVTGVLCNDSSLTQGADGNWRVTGDPTEVALVTLATKAGVPREPIARSHRVIRQLPFDSDRKRMSIVALDGRGHAIVHSKGSVEATLSSCISYSTRAGPRPLDTRTTEAFLLQAEQQSAKGRRVLALARRDLGDVGDTRAFDDADVETQLSFLGWVAMIDPPREGVREAVRLCLAAGIRPVMITGDHQLTALVIAEELGIVQPSGNDRQVAVLTGSDLDRMTDEQLDARIDSVRVCARVTAQQKLRLVGAFKRRGHIVAMTGDGVNDAPALREAHIGIAMGRSGTDVAREAADVIVADDNFVTIVDAIHEGRAIWRNIQKAIFFLLSSNAGLLAAVFVASFFRGLSPLTPLMILWINLVTNGLPALALGIDPTDSTQMLEPPRRKDAALLDARAWLGIGFVGLWVGAAAMACYAINLGPSRALAPLHARAVAFSLLALSPLMHSFSCRSPSASIFSLRPMLPGALFAAVGASAGIHFLALMVPKLRPVFQTFPLSRDQWMELIVLSFSIVPAVEILKLIDRSTNVSVRLTHGFNWAQRR